MLPPLRTYNRPAKNSRTEKYPANIRTGVHRDLQDAVFPGDTEVLPVLQFFCR